MCICYVNITCDTFIARFNSVYNVSFSRPFEHFVNGMVFVNESFFVEFLLFFIRF